MKKTIITLISLLALTACNPSKSADDQNTSEQETMTIGGEKDAHDCLVSAGEIWSQLKQNCVQIFTVGQRLNPIENQPGEAVISAFVLFNEDRSEAELFLPNKPQTFILKTTDDHNYEDGIYKFDTMDSSLYINDSKAFVLGK